MAPNIDNPDYLPLIHCLLNQGDSTELEKLRSADMATWILQNAATLEAVSFDAELYLTKLIVRFAVDHKQTPTLGGVLEVISRADKAEHVRDLLEEYEARRPNLKLLPVTDMGEVLERVRRQYEDNTFRICLDIARRISAVGREDPKTKKPVKGARDAFNWLMQRMQSGVFISNEGLYNRPIDVRNEADEICAWYDKRQTVGIIESGIPGLVFNPTNFVGLLGYTGGGKSNLGRFIAYQAAEQGHNVLHLSLENAKEIERNKFILLHAHNPKFCGAFRHLSYKKLITKGGLTPQERMDLAEVAADYKATIEGHITIYQPENTTWIGIKTIIELHALTSPIDMVLLDYIGLMKIPSERSSDVQAQRDQMIIDMRQFALTFGGDHKLCIVSPVQGNESGKQDVIKNDGIWDLSGVNLHKEISRSMDLIVGVHTDGTDMPGGRECILSCVKDRDGVGFKPVSYLLSDAGWITPQEVNAPVPATKKPSSKYVPPPIHEMTLEDIIYPEAI